MRQNGGIFGSSQVYLLVRGKARPIGAQREDRWRARIDGHEDDARSIPYLEPTPPAHIRNRGAPCRSSLFPSGSPLEGQVANLARGGLRKAGRERAPLIVLKPPLARLVQNTRLYCPSAGITPSCCSMPKASKFSQPSTNLPPTMRSIPIPVTVTGLPVGGMPMNSP